MISSSKRLSFPALAALALVAAGCSYSGEGQIPCVQDASCPTDYPVCGPAGKCIAGTPTAASVAITGVDGHAAADYLSGTVRVLVSARATSGVRSVTLASGSVNFPTSTVAAAAPLYAFDVNTTALTDGDATLTATLTGGDNSGATATGTLHVDNAKPVITSFTAAGLPSTTITAGTTASLGVSFTPATASATITDGSGVGSLTLTSSGSALVSPDVTTTFTVRVTSRSGVMVQSGTTGQPPDVTVSVVSPATLTGNFTVSPSVITSGDLGQITFTLSVSASVTAASIRDDLGTVVIPDALTTLSTAKPSSTRTYTLMAQNAAGATANATTSVTVRSAANPSNTTLLASAGSVTVGGSITLTPTFPAAYTGSISGPGISSPLVVTSGQQYPVTISVAGTNPYTLTVQNDATPIATFTTAATNVSGVAVPAIATFTASASTVTNGNTVTFTYNVTGGDCVAVPARCRITGPSAFTFDLVGTNDGSNHFSTAALPTASSTSTYALTLVDATGTAAGTVSRSIAVQAVAAPAAALVASAVEVAKGSTITLTPTFSGASSYIADDAGVHIVDNPVSAVAMPPITPARTNTYTLVALNAAGASATDSVTVTVLNTVVQTGSTTARFGATATLLNNGQVLIAGGGATAGGNGTNSVVLYSPSTRTYSNTGNLGTGRRDHTARLLSDGTVLLVGGFDGSGNPLRSLEAYDPSAGTFSPFAITGGTSGGMVNPRALHTSTVLVDGTLLVAGGCGTSVCDTTAPDSRDTAEIINLVAGSTAATTAMNARHVGATGTLLASGNVLIAGGATSAGGNGTDFAELFSAGTFTCPGTDCTTANRSHMTTARNGHGALLLPNGRVVLFGGKTNSGAMTATIELFDPAGNGTFATNAAGLVTARWLLQATQLGGAGRILISGGFTTGTTTASTVLNLFGVSGSTLTAVTGIDSLTTARGGHTATLLFGGAALLSGGTSSSASGELFSSSQ
jgi:hypothetical protein